MDNSNPIVSIEGTVLQVQFPTEVNNLQLKVCVTQIETDDGELVGLVEDVAQCFYARKLKDQIGNRVSVQEDANFFVEDEELTQILLQSAPQVKFLIFEAE